MSPPYAAVLLTACEEVACRQLHALVDVPAVTALEHALTMQLVDLVASGEMQSASLGPVATPLGPVATPLGPVAAPLELPRIPDLAREMLARAFTKVLRAERTRRELGLDAAELAELLHAGPRGVS